MRAYKLEGIEIDLAEVRPWHQMRADEVARALGTDPDNGLDEREAEARLERHGPNLLTPARTRGPLIRFMSQLNQPLIYILLAAGLITALLQEWVDSSVIFGVVLINAIVGFLQESKALNAIEALSRSMKTEATVLRNGQRRRVNAAVLAPGDIVLLQAGDKVPADLRLLYERGLQVDESALTGESVPVAKTSGVIPAETLIADRLNMAYSSTLVTHGAGRGVVVATGDATEIGKISELIRTAEVLATPLTRKIAHFSHVLLWVILALAGLTFLAGWLRGEAWLDMFLAAVALAVGAIPEGLPAALTITLAIGVNRMARRHAIIRRLPAVETLGSTTVICSDKTGTLTQNAMTVRVVSAGGGEYRVTGNGYTPAGEFETVRGPEPRGNFALEECLRAGLLCNDSSLVRVGGNWRAEGDPTEAALLSSAMKYGLSVQQELKRAPRLDAIPFESDRQFMATLHSTPDKEAPPVAYVKGAAEVLLPRCEFALGPDGAVVGLDAGTVQREAESLAAQALRVLLLARTELPAGDVSIDLEHVESGLTYLGLQGMIDPPRPEAVRSVQICRDAGIKVKMITGDHAKTAAAIASQIGLNGEALVALTGAELETIPDAELPDVAERTTVFARVPPEQKLRLVEALQARGHVVAMTGDGVNDAPALRRADIGVAMGITGTEVAKEAADMILTDDNFASIEAAVEEGRGVFDNLVKFIVWTIPTNVGEGLVILAAIFAGVTLPILPVQLLWINMTTAVALGLWLAMEPKEPGLMQRQPRDPATPILTGTLKFRIVLVGALLLAGAFGLFQWALRDGRPIAEARTLAVNVFVFGEMFYLFNCRSLTLTAFELGFFSNRWLIGGVVTMIALQLAYTYTRFMNMAFQSAPMDLIDWALVLSAAGAIFSIVGLEKFVRRLRARRSGRERV
jgi:cation-transporting ATPase F